MVRVVLDTNVLVSALLFPGGRLGGLRRLWQGEVILPLLSAPTVAELAAVLGYPKFKLDESARDELLADYLPFGEVVKPAKRAPSIPDCRDPFDRMFLQLAVMGRANWLVTRDKDLLALQADVSFKISDPAEFLRTFGAVEI
jgi:uncharacterized protein